MKSILAQQSPQRSPWGLTRLRQEMQDRREEKIGSQLECAAESLRSREELGPLGNDP